MNVGDKNKLTFLQNKRTTNAHDYVMNKKLEEKRKKDQL